MKNYLRIFFAVGLLASTVFAGEQSGPNPGNLAPSGSQSVSLYTGAFAYSYPIAVPPGRHGMQPDLTLLYNSQAGNGWLGVGWDLSVGSIQRSTKNGKPAYDDTDTFVFTFQGESHDLAPVGTGSDSQGSYKEYHEKIQANFMRFRRYDSGQWEGRAKDGKIYDFASLVSNFYWGLIKVSDPSGNYMTLAYPNAGGTDQSRALRPSSAFPSPGGGGSGGTLDYLPVSIQYTGHASDLSPTNGLTFQYEARPDILTSSRSGNPQELDYRLKEIHVQTNGQDVRVYTFVYGQNQAGSTLLTRITMTGNDGTSTLPSTTFTYQDNQGYSTTNSSVYVPPADFVSRPNIAYSLPQETALVDINGDGLPDIVGSIGGHTWLNTGSGWEEHDEWNAPVPTSGIDQGVRFVDLNGDGLVDIVWEYESAPIPNKVPSSVQVQEAWINNGHGWDKAPQWNPPTPIVMDGGVDLGVRFIDVNGDGLPDIVQNASGENAIAAHAWLNNGNGWTPADNWIPPVRIVDWPGSTTTVDEGVRFVDLNGDGLTDIIQGESSNFDGAAYQKYGAWLNTGSGWVSAPKWIIPIDFVYRSDLNSSYGLGTEIVDINGDGLPDIVRNLSGEAGSTVQAFINTGNGFVENDAWTPPVRLADWVGPFSSVDEGVRYADLNGDGLVDLIQSQSNAGAGGGYNNHQAMLAQGGAENALIAVNNGMGGSTQIAYGSVDTYGGHVPFPVRVVQSVTNTDTVSRSSVTVQYAYAGGLYDGSSSNREFLGFNKVTTTDAQGNYTVTNFLQNDNAEDHVNVYEGKIAEQDSYDASGNTLTRTVNTWADDVSNIQDSFINITTTTHLYNAQDNGNFSGVVYLPDPAFEFYGPAISTRVFAVANNFGPQFSPGTFWCAGDGVTILSDGCDDGSVRVEFSTNQGARDMEFSESPKSLTYVGSINFPMAPDTYRDPNSAVQATMTLTGRKRVAVYFPHITSVDSYIGNKHSSVSFSNDAYGNVTEEDHAGDVDVQGDERTVVTQYSNNDMADVYLVGVPTERQVYSGTGASKTLASQTQFYYDQPPTQIPTVGNLTKVDNFLAGGIDPVATYSYDAFGNLTDTFDAAWYASNGQRGNHTHTVYESALNQFPQSVTQAVRSSLSLPSESFSFDPGTGQMTTHVDVNGSTTTYHFDPFGRLVSVIGPNDSQIYPSQTYQYVINATAPSYILSESRVVHGSSVTINNYTFVDGLGRKIQSKVDGPANSQIISDTVIYDNRGLVITSYSPYSRAVSSTYVPPNAGQSHTNMTHDALGRVTLITQPDGSQTSEAYQDWTETVTDANHHSKTTVKDAYGQIIEVDEHYNNGQSSYQTTYHYDALGNMTQVMNSLLQPITLSYDSLSRKISMTDPQMGFWQYQYDPNGNLARQIDAKSQTMTMTYDPLNRLTSKIYPDTTTISYQYDTGPFAMGRLSQVNDLSGTQAFTYDNTGMVLSKKRTIGGKTYTTSMTYDALGRETSLTYPDFTTVNNLYDASAIRSVESSDGNLAYATLSYSTAAPGKISQVHYGNALTTQFFYDTATYRLNGLVTAPATGAPVQKFGYQFDPVGNISQINDSVGPMTQTFQYDELDRLTQAVGPYGAKTYSYDSLGNTPAFSPHPPSAPGFVTSIISFGSVRNNSSGWVGMEVQVGSAPLSVSALGRIYLSGNSQPHQLKFVTASTGQDVPGGSVTVTPGGTANQFSYATLSAPITLAANTLYYLVSHEESGGDSWYDQNNTVIASAADASVPGGVWMGDWAPGLWNPWAAGNHSFGPVDFRYEIVRPATPSVVTSITSLGTIRNNSSGWVGMEVQVGSAPLSVTALGRMYLSGNTQSHQLKFVAASTGQDVPGGSVSVTPSGTANQFSYGTLNAPITLAANTLYYLVTHEESGGDSWYDQNNTVVNSAADASIPGGVWMGDWAPGVWNPWAVVNHSFGPVDFRYAVPASASAASQSANAPSNPKLSAASLGGSGVQTDANGNLIADASRQITYDFENRPIQIVTADGAVTQFVYDFEGSRVQKTITKGGQTQTTTYLGDIYEVTGSQTIKYITAGSLRVAMIDSTGNATYFLPDHLGSANILADGDQNIVRTTQYTPFGSTYQTSGTMDNDHKFTDQRLDDSTGLYYYGARYYDPAAGRFITPDTLIQNPYDPQTLNRYVYCRNNPISYNDPSGRYFVIDDLIIIAAYTLINAGVAAANGGNIGTAAWHGAVQGLAFDAANDLGGPVAGAMAAGAVGNALNGGGVGGAFQGAVIGGMTAGIAGAIPLPSNAILAGLTQTGVGGLLGGGISAATGGKFLQGAEQGAISAAMATVVAQAAANIGSQAQQVDQQQSAQAEKNLNTDISADEASQVDIPDQSPQNLVIGKLNDIQILKPGEYNLLDQLPDLGNPQDNWYQNASALRSEMANGIPIRDASPHIQPSIGPASFLDAERNVLSNHGWTYDSGTQYWVPPKR